MVPWDLHAYLDLDCFVQRVQSIADQNRAIIAAIQERQDAVERQLNLLQESKQHTNTGWGLGWGLRG